MNKIDLFIWTILCPIAYCLQCIIAYMDRVLLCNICSKELDIKTLLVNNNYRLLYFDLYIQISSRIWIWTSALARISSWKTAWLWVSTTRTKPTIVAIIFVLGWSGEQKFTVDRALFQFIKILSRDLRTEFVCSFTIFIIANFLHWNSLKAIEIDIIIVHSLLFFERWWTNI